MHAANPFPYFFFQMNYSLWFGKGIRITEYLLVVRKRVLLINRVLLVSEVEGFEWIPCSLCMIILIFLFSFDFFS
jgi:hypothetical protein